LVNLCYDFIEQIGGEQMLKNADVLEKTASEVNSNLKSKKKFRTLHIIIYYLTFCYRFNRRKFKREIFDHLLFAVAASKPLTLAELT